MLEFLQVVLGKQRDPGRQAQEVTQGVSWEGNLDSSWDERPGTAPYQFYVQE